MANKEHLDILKKGVPAWNKWRENNQKIQPDLSETNLSGADLGGTDLSGTNLNGANLILANLIKTFLNGADLTTALLGETIFSDVDLSETDGLDECQHLGPSTVDHRTLMKSGALPPKFLTSPLLPKRALPVLLLLHQLFRKRPVFCGKSLCGPSGEGRSLLVRAGGFEDWR